MTEVHIGCVDHSIYFMSGEVIFSYRYFEALGQLGRKPFLTWLLELHGTCTGINTMEHSSTSKLAMQDICQIWPALVQDDHHLLLQRDVL